MSLSRGKTSSTADQARSKTSTTSAAAEVVAASTAAALAGKAAPPQQHHLQQPQIQVSADYSAEPDATAAAAAGAVRSTDQERYFSMTGSPGREAAGVEPAVAPPASPLLPEQEEESDGFQEAAEGSIAASTASSAADGTGEAASSAGSWQGGVIPYTEEQLQALIGGSLDRRYWEAIHDGVGSIRDVYSIRGPNYLKDRKKIPAGESCA